MTETKWCPRCLDFYPATREFFSSGKSENGLSSWCKECKRAYAKKKADEGLAPALVSHGELKSCLKCGEGKPATLEHFYMGKGVLRNTCKECLSSIQKAKAAADPLLIAKREARAALEAERRPDGGKKCPRCEKVYPATREFFYSGNTKDGLHNYCKGCFKEWTYAKRAENPEKVREIGRRSRLNNHEKVKAQQREKYHRQKADPEWAEKERQRGKDRAAQVRQENPERVRKYLQAYRERHPELVRERQKIYHARAYSRDPEKFKARTAKQRAERAQVPGDFTGHDLNAAFKRQNGCCLYCGTKIKWRETLWEADHFIPISKGGSNYPENIVIACRTCNRSKCDRLPWDWMPERFSAPEPAAN